MRNFKSVFVILICFQSILMADINVSRVFSDHMVLQREQSIPIWGTASAGEEIIVSLAGWKKQTRADKSGKWRVEFGPKHAGGPYKMIITGNNSIVISDLLVGEVWLCSGQSNMAKPLHHKPRQEDIVNYKAEIQNANYPEIRMFTVQGGSSPVPMDDLPGWWSVCTPDSARNFSAVAYFYGRELYKNLNVPIGLIHSSQGGSVIEAWIPFQGKVDYDAAYKDYIKHYGSISDWWEQENLSRKQQGLKPLKPLNKPRSKGGITRGLVSYVPAFLYNARIAPFVPYALRGVIWYQGECSITRAASYRDLMDELVSSWRRMWRHPDMPFYYVQIHPYLYPDTQRSGKAAELREAQLQALSIPNTGMVVTMDIGNPQDNHPGNKREVGRRLAFWALSETYHFQDLVYSGPLYDGYQIEGDSIRIYFEHVGSGLEIREGESLIWFTIADKDQNFVSANAKIDGNTVLVWSTKIENPVAVRYGWHDAAELNLMNKEGLPASPFRTDDWPLITEQYESW